MIVITERAKKALLAKKRAAGVVDLEVALRLASAPDGALVLMLDWPRAGDHVVTYKESTVLLADPDTAAFITAGRTVDCRRTTAGRVEIVLRNRHLRGGAPGSSGEPRSA